MTATKDRVFVALRDGATVREAADTLKISKSTVKDHARDLVRRGVLELVQSDAREHRFKRGAKAHPYEVAMDGRTGKRRVGSNEGAPEAAVRVHRGGWAWAVRWGPAVPVPWDRSWKAKSGQAVELDHRLTDAEGFQFWFKETTTGDPAKLMVTAPEVYVFDPKEIASARDARRARCERAVSAFAEKYGLKLAGPGKEFAPTEYAVEMPGLEKFGVPGESFWWVDGSPGDGRMEAESQDVGAAQVLVQFPTWTREIKEENAAQRREIDGLKTVVAELSRNLTDVVKIQSGTVALLVGPKPRDLRPENDPGVA